MHRNPPIGQYLLRLLLVQAISRLFLAYLLTHSAAQRNTVGPFWCGRPVTLPCICRYHSGTTPGSANQKGYKIFSFYPLTSGFVPLTLFQTCEIPRTGHWRAALIRHSSRIRAFPFLSLFP